MDTTDSMQNYLNQAKNYSKYIMSSFSSFKQKYPLCSIKYSFVSYKDHKYPYESPQNQNVVQSFDFDQLASIQRKILNVEAEDGDDTAQAVHDGLNAVKNLSWRNNSTKLVFLIFDSPPHGKQYAEDILDIYKEGCPCKIKLQQIKQYYKEKNIYLSLKKCGNKTGNTIQVFKQIFPSKLLEAQTLVSQEYQKNMTQNKQRKVSNQKTKSNKESNKLDLQQFYYLNVLKQILKLQQKKNNNSKNYMKLDSQCINLNNFMKNKNCQTIFFKKIIRLLYRNKSRQKPFMNNLIRVFNYLKQFIKQSKKQIKDTKKLGKQLIVKTLTYYLLSLQMISNVNQEIKKDIEFQDKNGFSIMYKRVKQKRICFKDQQKKQKITYQTQITEQKGTIKQIQNKKRIK